MSLGQSLKRPLSRNSLTRGKRDIGYSQSFVCPTITLGVLSNGTVGFPYNQSVMVTGGTSPYLLSVTAGSLPTGLSLVYNGMFGLWVVSGTPTTFGSYTFTISGTDANGCPASRSYTMLIGQEFIGGAWAASQVSVVVSGISGVMGTDASIGGFTLDYTCPALENLTQVLQVEDPLNFNITNILSTADVSGADLTQTFMTDSAITDISLGSAPYTGSFYKSYQGYINDGFVGSTINGTWHCYVDGPLLTVNSIKMLILPI